MTNLPTTRTAAPGFFDGATSVIRGFRFLFRTPPAWPLAAVPALVLMVLSTVAAAIAVRFVPGAITALLPTVTSTFAQFGATILRMLVTIIAIVFGFVVSFWATPPLSAPALERLVLLRERELGVAPRPALPFYREFSCALTAQLVSIAVGVPLFFTLWLLDFLIPPLAPVLLPLKFLLISALAAWNLLDYPLSLRGMSLPERIALLRRGAPAVLGFGATFAILLAIPASAVLLLPAAALAAAELTVSLERSAGLLPPAAEPREDRRLPS